MSPRTRELGFMVPALLLGLVGAGSVASARTDTLDYGPLPGVAGVVVVFLAMHIALRLRAPRADAYVLPIVGVLVAIGLVELYRISPELAADQAIWMAVGGVAFIITVVALPDHRVLERYTYLIGLAAVGLLVITMVFGTRINGAKLWIQIGGGQTVQLGEVAKVLMVVFLAAYLRDKRELLAIPTGRVMGVPVPPMAALGPVLLFLGACLALVVVLNDFGTALLFLGIFLAMIYLATGRVAYTGFGLAAFVVGSAAVYTVVPRIQTRVDNWLRPFDDAQDQGYQLVQSLYALAEGGIIGPGLGRGFLVTSDGTTVIPALQTDFMFSAVASELGYIGGVGLLLGFLVLIQRGFVIAAQANDGFSKLLAGGLTAALGLQAILIIGGVTRLIPLTGVTLPFLSYGGSSVVTNFVLIALLLIISHRSATGNAPSRRERKRAEQQAREIERAQRREEVAA
ncbi:FtsW/RodA/SpoVE family cell cycle protein [Miltoncostaea oceani]|uniref:FtsW/RodA/SpoVE family cell cycle protein n=1 Tax=Miltoncostaea oceani TaxID=2843216 RepID=UPI001C3D2446|nr:FtsW/RodA/SpoVE family cell cycle protein [Miltoncostaea oceani]